MNQESAPSRYQRLRPWLAGALLALLPTLVYARSLTGGFVWDDLLLVNQNPLVQGDFTLGTIWFRTDFPLSNVALWLEWLAFGKHAAGYRVVNLLLHATGCVLLWRVLARLKIPGAWLAAALFAVHPVAVGSVAWISEIKNTLSLPFCLVSFWFYLQAETTATLNRPGVRSAFRPAYVVSLVAFLLALLTKTSIVGLPVILLACAWWQRGRFAKADFLRAAPHFALALIFGLLTVWFQTHQTLAGMAPPSASFPAKLTSASLAVWFYLSKALLPLHLNAVYPPWKIVPGSMVAFLPVLALALVAAVGWRFRRSWGRHVLFALVALLAALFPILGFFDMYFLVISPVSDHFQYVALIVPLTAVAALVSVLRPKLLACLTCALLIATLAILAVPRARVFATDELLWRDTLAKNPAAWNAHNNLACILAEKNEFAEAASHFETSLQLNPRNASAHCNLGKICLLKNQVAAAEAHFRAALALKPDHLETLKSYAQLLAGQGRLPDAIQQLRAALQVKPENETRLQLAPLLPALGQDAEAVTLLRAVLATEPDSLAALQNLGWLLATSYDEKVRNGQEAVRLTTRACELTRYKDARMLSALAAAHAETGKFPEAATTAQQAITTAQTAGDPDFARINAQLLRLYQNNRPYHSPAPNPTP